MVSYDPEVIIQKMIGVLILIVVDDGLVPTDPTDAQIEDILVLILIVVDDGLVQVVMQDGNHMLIMS